MSPHSADSGALELTLDSVVSVVSAGDLLLLDWVVASCQQFLLTNIHTDNVVTAARIASLYRCLLGRSLFSKNPPIFIGIRIWVCVTNRNFKV